MTMTGGLFYLERIDIWTPKFSSLSPCSRTAYIMMKGNRGEGKYDPKPFQKNQASTLIPVFFFRTSAFSITFDYPGKSDGLKRKWGYKLCTEGRLDE